jgi:hypothetical protein
VKAFLKLVPPPQPQRPRLATWGPQLTDPNLAPLPRSQAPPAHLGPGCRSAITSRPSRRPATTRPPLWMHAQTHAAAGPENELDLRLRLLGEYNARPQAQRARAARCAANNAAPGGQPAVTVPSRRGSDWRPGPICLPFNSAPRGAQQQLGLGAPVGETSRTSKPRRQRKVH